VLRYAGVAGGVVRRGVAGSGEAGVGVGAAGGGIPGTWSGSPQLQAKLTPASLSSRVWKALQRGQLK
jgi:hypothetical protein